LLPVANYADVIEMHIATFTSLAFQKYLIVQPTYSSENGNTLKETAKLTSLRCVQSGHTFQASSCSTFSTKPIRGSLLLQRICRKKKSNED
jgi:hypothetical protein